MPLLRMAMYRKGIQRYCAPTADPRETWVASMRHIACEGRCFVLAANQFARRSDYPDDYPVDVPADHVMCRGNSVIVSPLGKVLAGPETSGRGDPARRGRHRPDRRRQVRLRCCRPLLAARCLPARGQRAAAGLGGEADMSPSGRSTIRRNSRPCHRPCLDRVALALKGQRAERKSVDPFAERRP